MVQIATLAIALVAAASGVSAHKQNCRDEVVYCGLQLNGQPLEYTFDELRAAVVAGGGSANASPDYLLNTLYTCGENGTISTTIPDDHCTGQCIWWFPGNPQCPGVDCCV
ncbi:hypothetical protein NLU13_4693 [Sarocladium strictum]|uniref:Uncharacterized protein n=1 Tax=Sarocladium strictum TaxID=5046 RepID=A0AA39GL25_SARSR|nr:hypothetical protein NLU13_4693 [Sarocladium strictum]